MTSPSAEINKTESRTNMNRTMQLAALAAALSLAPLTLKADQTNLVQNLNISLTAYQQGGSVTKGKVTTTSLTKTTVATADVIAALGAATGNSFSSQAQLVFITTLPYGTTGIAVEDGTNSVDMSLFFVCNTLSDTVGRSTINVKNGKDTGSTYSISQFILQDSPFYPPLTLHYNLTGLTTQDYSNLADSNPRNKIDATVSGMGDSQGSFVLFQGTISTDDPTLVVVASPPPCD
jgi:hypothetical protein